VHLFTSQMAVAFIRLRNRLVDRLREDGTAEDALLEEHHPNQQQLLADKRRHATPGLDARGTTKPGLDRERDTGLAVRQ
jgi:hypothetical protein